MEVLNQGSVVLRAELPDTQQAKGLPKAALVAQASAI
eukprot:CAMPEP_0185615990 /NCGR_PEP_ID=MMETSP0436-20130131/37968_1 /TAXON_ID=626734 ORGANISM="Favella taraikaensis, Strain Fe Narragansett Bay" /NCGR_SAMPLE_ID=MMETSP0436 /ASSEMBLY_ACC=CAM_ASM_000390 /LENGTH=36 /DNA_ID= /DNA_START= /DNA_END= /DNA_ORIENTATION=